MAVLYGILFGLGSIVMLANLRDMLMRKKIDILFAVLYFITILLVSSLSIIFFNIGAGE